MFFRIERSKPGRRVAFSLLEMIVVMAIIAVIGGGLLAAFSGLEDDAASAQSGFNVSAIERALYTYVKLNQKFPDEWDSLVTGDASANPFRADDLLDRLTPELTNNLRWRTMSQNDLNALTAIGITTVRNIDTGAAAANQYNDDDDFTNDNVEVPNRLFDNAVAASGYYGVPRVLVRNDRVANVRHNRELGETLGLAANDRVVALGLGNNNSFCDPSMKGSLGYAPFAKVAPGRYGRYIALFMVRESGTSLSSARFLGIVDPQGKLRDEAFAVYTDGP